MTILLYTKGYSTEEIEHTMDILKENNFINDEKFAESYLYSEVIKRGKPVFLSRKKLEQRGIDPTIIEKFIEENEDDIRE